MVDITVDRLLDIQYRLKKKQYDSYADFVGEFKKIYNFNHVLEAEDPEFASRFQQDLTE